jgi:hypothetical protein
MANKTDATILEWLVRLGALCRAKWGKEEALERLREYIPPLRTLPIEVFCDASRNWVARQQIDFPAYGALHGLLEKWWSDNKPRPAGYLPGPVEASNLSANGKIWASMWFSRVRDGLSDAQQRHLLGLVRVQAAPAYWWLLRNDNGAARVAVAAGMPTIEDMRPEWDDAVGISCRVDELLRDRANGVATAEACLLLLRRAVAANAPQHLHLIPA